MSLHIGPGSASIRQMFRGKRTTAVSCEQPRGRARAWTTFFGLALSLALVGWFLLPRALESLIAARVAGLGFRQPSVRVVRLGPNAVEFEQFRTEDDWRLRLRSATVRYTGPSLLAGRVETIALDGLTLRLLPREKWPPALLRHRDEGGTPARWPFTCLTLRDGLAVLPDLGPLTVTEASVENRGQAWPDFSLDATLNGTRLTAEGRNYALDGCLRARVQVPALDLARWSPLVARALGQPDFSATGRGTLAGAADIAAERFSADLSLSGGGFTATAPARPEPLALAWDGVTLRAAGPLASPLVSDISASVSNLSVTTGARALTGIPRVTVAITPSNSITRFAVDVDLAEGLRLHARGARLPGGAVVIDNLSTSGRGLADPAELSRRCTLLRDLRISGRPALLRGRVDLTDDAPAFSLDAEFRDVGLASKTWDFTVTGLNGPLALRSGAAGYTPGEQRLTIGELRVGTLLLTRGELLFHVRLDRSVEVHSLAFDWGGGRLVARDVLLSAARPTIDVRLDVEHVDLGQVLALVAAGRASGAGKLSGTLALAISRAPSPALVFGSGQLAADPGGGWFQIPDPSDTATLIGVKTAAGRLALAADQQLSERITRAFRDFAFDDLSIEFKPETGKLLTCVKTRGRGPRDNQPLTFGGLTFNIRGLDTLLNVLILRTQQVKARLHDNLQRQVDAVTTPAASRTPPADAQAVQRAIDNFF